MRIGIISESPTLTTGFGVTCKKIIEAVNEVGYEVSCFGIGSFGETFDRSEFPCEIWTVGRDNLVQKLGSYLNFRKLDVIILNSDLLSVQRWIKICRGYGWKGKAIAHFVIDGIPINKDYLIGLHDFDIKITPTKSAAKYLETMGLRDILVASHGVDQKIFKPLENRSELRKIAGIHEKFVVGVFGRNTMRKQQPRILLALKELQGTPIYKQILVYFHCQPKDEAGLMGWDLEAVAKELQIDDKVFFPHKSFVETTGVPRESVSIKGGKRGNHKNSLFPSEFGYVERLNCCDVIVNVPFCGGFELVTIEAQACGIPLISTADEGIMSEVVGDGGVQINAIDKGIWHTGAFQHFVSPSSISVEIQRVLENEELRNELVSKGHRNITKYDWNELKNTIAKSLNQI